MSQLTKVNSNAIELKPLALGTMAPYFSGIDQYGDFHSLETLKKNKPIILFFYRGYWCSMCMEHLTNFQQDLNEIQDQGFKVVVITNEAEEYRNLTVAKTKLKFPVLIDFNNSIMESYNVAFNVNHLEAISKKYQFDANVEFHKVNGKEVLPVPATYLIDKNGIIKYMHYNPDFTDKASLKSILEKIA